MKEKKQGKEERRPGLLGGLFDFLKVLEGMEKKGVREENRQGIAPGPYGSQVHYSYNVRIGGLSRRPGSPSKIQSRRKTLEVPEEEREGLIDVFEGPRTVRVVAELPGVESMKEVHVKLVEHELHVKAGTTERRIPLPKTVKRIRKTAFKHGILEVTLEKEGGKK